MKREIFSSAPIGKRIIPFIALLIAFALFRYLLPERPLEYTGPRALADHFFAIGLLGGILLIGGGIGLKIIRGLRIIPLSYLETIIFVVPLGLGVFAYGILALGLLGLLKISYLLLWFILAFFWSCREWWELAVTGMVKLRGTSGIFRRQHIGKKLLLITFLLLFCMTLFQALAPPWDYDGLMYHLQGPRLFLEAGRILPLPNTWQANGPLTIEMLFMFGLRFGSDTFAKLLHLSYAMLLVLATFTFGRRFLGGDGGWIAATVLVAIPMFPAWSSSAHGDMAWAVYEFLGVYALILWIKTTRRGWLMLSALMIGMALGSKYLALGTAGALGLVVIWTSRRQEWKFIIQNVAIFWGIAFVVGSPWYLKNWLWMGNPVYPLYFGGVAWPAERVRLLMSFLYSFGTGHRVLDYLLLPWNLYAQNHRYATSGVSIELPSFLFPFLLLYPFVRQKKIIRLLAIIVLMRLIIWATGSQQIRFLLPVFPGLSILTAGVLLGLAKPFVQKQGARIIQVVALSSVVVITILVTMYFLVLLKPFTVVIGNESKLAFLTRINTTTSAILFIQQYLAPEERVLFLWEGEGYYCDQRCLPDAEQSRWTWLVMSNHYNIPAVSKSLGDAGITHLLYSKSSPDLILRHDPSGENDRATSFFNDEYSNRCTELIYRDRASDLYKITCHDVAR